MTTQISKRALTAGLGLGTVALLAPTQRASAADISFTSFAFPATGAPTPRTMPDRLADVVNVRDFGAVGDGIKDDRAAIQAAIDAAFGPAASPNGTAATKNRALFFPNGNYVVSSPLVLTRVRGAHIYGAGQFNTTIQGAPAAFVTNGLEYCCFEHLGFYGRQGTGNVAFELDWDGNGQVGLKGNIYTNCLFSLGDYGCRIGLSNHGGSNNQFYGCTFVNTTIAGMVAWSTGAFGQSVQGGSAANSATAFWAKDGQIASINDVGLAENSAQDILMDSVGPMLVKGCRTESFLFCRFNNSAGSAVLEGCLTAATVREFCRPNGKVILDSCVTDWSSNIVFCSDPAFRGTVYVRGCYFPQSNFLTGFNGTIGQRI